MVAANGEKSVECGRESLETLGACVTEMGTQRAECLAVAKVSSRDEFRPG